MEEKSLVEQGFDLAIEGLTGLGRVIEKAMTVELLKYGIIATAVGIVVGIAVMIYHKVR